MTPAEARALYEQVLDHVVAYQPLGEPLCYDPDAQAAFALMQLIVHGGLGKPHRLQAIKEYNERVWGKVKDQGTGPLDSEQLDLSKLDEDELATLIALLKKAERTPGKEG